MVISLIVPMGCAMLAEPGHVVAVVRLTGSIDAAAETSLARTAHQLTALRPQTVFVDLESVTSARDQLPAFLADLDARLSRTAVLLLCAANPAIRALIHSQCQALARQLCDIRAPYRFDDDWYPAEQGLSRKPAPTLMRDLW